MSQKRLDQRFNEMVEMREQGKSIIEIAKYYGISKQRVSELFNQHGMPLRVSLKNSDIKRLKDPEIIASTYKVTILHVKSRMRRLGLSYPKKQGRNTIKWTKEKVAVLYAEYENGLSQQQLGEKYKTSQTRISTLFLKYGFKTRQGGWPEGKPRKYF
jgi:transposase